MADERTASNITWFNSAVRNKQHVPTLVNMIQICQWYIKGIFACSLPLSLYPVSTVKYRDMDQVLFERKLEEGAL